MFTPCFKNSLIGVGREDVALVMKFGFTPPNAICFEIFKTRFNISNLCIYCDRGSSQDHISSKNFDMHVNQSPCKYIIWQNHLYPLCFDEYLLPNWCGFHIWELTWKVLNFFKNLYKPSMWLLHLQFYLCMRSLKDFQ